MRTKDATWHLQRVTYIAWLVAFLAWKVVEPRPKPTCQSRILPTGNKGMGFLRNFYARTGEHELKDTQNTLYPHWHTVTDLHWAHFIHVIRYDGRCP